MNIWELDATQIAAGVRSGQFSAEEVAIDVLHRVEAVNPSLNAIVESSAERTIDAARAVDEALAAGAEPGVLAGVPLTIKVVADEAGWATTNGVRLQQKQIAAQDNPLVFHLKAAGGVSIGRTNTPAFSLRWFTSNRLYGTTRNPHNIALTPGGSSGGASAAVAAGLGAIAHGTDIAGSVRYPAYACGVHGLRPTPGRISYFNATAPARGIGQQFMSVSGPIARSVADLRLALGVMAQGDVRDPTWVPAPFEGPQVPRHAALCTHPAGLNTHPRIVRALEDAARRLRERGWQVTQVENVPPLREASVEHIYLWMGDGFDSRMAKALKEEDPGALATLRGQRELVANMDVARFSEALTRRLSMLREWQLFFDRYPVLLMPVSSELPFPDELDAKDEPSYRRVWEAQIPLIGTAFVGLPGVTVATGVEECVPVGVQVLAGRFREDLCLKAAADIEADGFKPRVVTPEFV
ncbi:amidase family protein [Bordetella sp. 15P40C-2]|uniref:amidase family protein n=1 Tax=Bordetella sp. 15P40C-2 TaxID=2572246 RepID=UPI0013222708|nr:amidase family protein [Bordetella sp. 15P40C-2]MVW72699.1 amidase [Bordetella sp. 15P40C-2]